MVITLNRNQIKYDVDLETRKSAVMMQEKGEKQFESQMGMSDNDKDFFERKCREGVDQLLDLCYKYVVSCNLETRALDNASDELDGECSWVITLSFSIRHNPIAGALREAFHSFVTNYVLNAWSELTVPTMQDKYTARLVKAADDIERMIYRKDFASSI